MRSCRWVTTLKIRLRGHWCANRHFPASSVRRAFERSLARWLGVRVAPFLASVTGDLVFGCLCRVRVLVFGCLCRFRDFVFGCSCRSGILCSDARVDQGFCVRYPRRRNNFFVGPVTLS